MANVSTGRARFPDDGELRRIGAEIDDTGVSMRELAERCGASRNTLRNALRRIGWQRQLPPADDSSLVRWAQRAYDGEPLDEIVAEIGISVLTLQRRLDWAGLDYRSPALRAAIADAEARPQTPWKQIAQAHGISRVQLSQHLNAQYR